MNSPYRDLLEELRQIHAAIRDTVITAVEQQTLDELALPVGDDAGDTIFAIDRVSEAVLLEHFAQLAQRYPLVLIAEGLGSSGEMLLPLGIDPAAASLRVIVDPIDGTRGLMYQKRPGWILTGVAPNRGAATKLSDIELALMTEIPLAKQHLCDQFWAQVGQGVSGERLNRISGERRPLRPQPSRATHVAQGFGGVSRFFPGGRDILAAIDDEIVADLLGPPPPGRAQLFEDQYICSGGQLAELLLGHDRYVADLRPLLVPLLAERGLAPLICSHPYDLCTELIAREAGITVCAPSGTALQAPLDVTTDVAWVGCANPTLAAQVLPALQRALARRNLV